MTRFYDSLDSRELARVQHILKWGGVEYTLLTGVGDSAMNEIQVAEEDLVYADALLSGQSGTVH